jgi:hypothetical protein
LVSSIPASDPLTFNTVLGQGAQLIFKGAAPTQTPLTVTLVRLKNRATNTPWALTLAGAAGPSVNTRIIDTTNGGIFWGVKDEGANVLRISEPLTASVLPNYPTNANRVTPLAGDTYATQALVSIVPGSMTINGIRGFGNGSLRPDISFIDLDFGAVGGGDASNLSGSNISWHYWGCHFSRGVLLSTCRVIGFVNCAMHPSVFCSFVGTIVNSVLGGAILNATSGVGGALLMIESAVHFDLDTLIQSSSVFCQAGSRIEFGTTGIFDSVPGGENSDGSGVYVRTGGIAIMEQDFDTVSALWGAGNAGTGVAIEGAGSFAYDAVSGLTITGTAGDLALGGQSTHSFSYSVSTAAPSASVTPNWTNLGTADGAGSGLWYPAKGCGITKQ